MHYRNGRLDPLLDSIPPHIPVTIINQEPGKSLPTQDVHQLRANVRCLTFAERGLSRSRNRAIQASVGEFLVICDDDIVFFPNAFDRIRASLDQYPADDLLTFKMTDRSGTPRKRYRAYSFRHNRRTIAKVSSCEIGLRRRSLLEHQVTYDERFGLGAEFPLGEEVVFLHDCLARGMSIRFVPAEISMHPLESTGNRMDAATERGRGALVQRLFGAFAIPIGLFFYLKKLHELPAGFGIRAALRAYWGGCRAFARPDH